MGIVFEVAFAGLVVTVPLLQHVFGTIALQLWLLATPVPLPFLIWGCDEMLRWRHDENHGGNMELPGEDAPVRWSAPMEAVACLGEAVPQYVSLI